MSVFASSAFTDDQIERIISDIGCRRSSAISKVKLALRYGMEIDYLINQGLHKMRRRELRRYLRNPLPRKYVEALSGRRGAVDFEIYQQMVRARNEFGVTYKMFAKKKLVDATDERLKEVREMMDCNSAKLLSKIAEDLSVSMEEAQEVVDRIQGKFGYGIREIHYRRYHTMSDDEIQRASSEVVDYKNRIIEKVKERTGWTDTQVLSHMGHCEIEYGIGNIVYLCSKCYKMDDFQLALCGNNVDTKKISARYNNGRARLLWDKELFNETYRDFLGRKFWMNRDTSFEEFKEFADGLDTLFCKPVDSGGGKGAFKYDLGQEDLESAFAFFMEQPKCLVEESVVQHPEMAKFHPGSLNTVRLTTILDDNEFKPLLSLVRFGNGGIVDNYSAGGIACAVDPETGIVSTDASNEDGDTFEIHPTSKLRFKGFQIPYWDKVLEKTEAALRAVDDINYVGWDIAITEDDVVIIEGNSAPCMGNQQSISDSDRVLIRPIYYKYLGTSVYDDMLDKIIDNMKAIGVTEKEATNRLVETAKLGLDYDFVWSQELCRMTVKQIRRYVKRPDINALVSEVASNNGSTIAEAFLQMRHAEKEFDIPFEAFAREDLFGADDQKLGQFAQD